MGLHYVEQIAEIPKWYGDLKIFTYAPQYYIPLRIKRNEYSRLIVASKEEDESAYFLGYFRPMWNDLKNEKRIGSTDLLVPLPRSCKGVFSVTIMSLGKIISEKTGVPFEAIIDRKRDLPKSSDMTTEGRIERNIESLTLLRPLKETEKKVILLDDLKTSGSTALEAAKILKNAGATDITLLCLGINSG